MICREQPCHRDATRHPVAPASSRRVATYRDALGRGATIAEESGSFVLDAPALDLHSVYFDRGPAEDFITAAGFKRIA